MKRITIKDYDDFIDKLERQNPIIKRQCLEDIFDTIRDFLKGD